jgi:hypothetical protein
MTQAVKRQETIRKKVPPEKSAIVLFFKWCGGAFNKQFADEVKQAVTCVVKVIALDRKLKKMMNEEERRFYDSL